MKKIIKNKNYLSREVFLPLIKIKNELEVSFSSKTVFLTGQSYNIIFFENNFLSIIPMDKLNKVVKRNIYILLSESIKVEKYDKCKLSEEGTVFI